MWKNIKWQSSALNGHFWPTVLFPWDLWSIYTGRVREDFANAVVCVADPGIDHWSIPALLTQTTLPMHRTTSWRTCCKHKMSQRTRCVCVQTLCPQKVKSDQTSLLCVFRCNPRFCFSGVPVVDLFEFFREDDPSLPLCVFPGAISGADDAEESDDDGGARDDGRADGQDAKRQGDDRASDARVWWRAGSGGKQVWTLSTVTPA